MSLKHLTSTYIDLLPFAVIPTTILGFQIGYTYSRRWNNFEHTFFNPHRKFTCIIGFTSIGILTGITYPISFPILALYTFFRIK
jgi:hypothetical protein